MTDGRFPKGHVPWNKGKKLPAWFRKRLSDARYRSKYRTGELHPRWKTGTRSYYLSQARLVMSNEKKQCASCGGTKRIHIHHINRDWTDNRRVNLRMLCISCHLKVHHAEDNKRCTCEYCGFEFKAGRRVAKYCSSRCRSASWKSRRNLKESNK